MPASVQLALAGWTLMLAGDYSLEVWEPVVLKAVGARMRGRTAVKSTAEGRRMFASLSAQGATEWGDVTPEMTQRWLWAARPDRGGRWKEVAVSTARNRRCWALVCLEEAARLGAPIDPIKLAGEPIPKPTNFTSARPLDALELRRVQVHAQTGLFVSRRLLIVALSVAGATATEIALARLPDIDLDACTVTLRGTAARTNPLGAWATGAIRKWLINQSDLPDPSGPLCVSADLSLDRAAHSVTVRLGSILRDAGLKGIPGVTARSLRLTTARDILESDGLTEAAKFLGSPSLDSTAAALGFDWRRDG